MRCLSCVIVCLCILVHTGMGMGATLPLQQYGLGILHDVAISDDGEYALSAGGAGAYLWDADSGELLRRYVGHDGALWCVDIAPDTSFVATGSLDNTAIVYDKATGLIRQRFSGHTGQVLCLEISPNGQFLATGSKDTTARLWHVATGEEALSPLPCEFQVNDLTFSPDGQFLLTGANAGKLSLWNTSSGALVREYTGFTTHAIAVTFSPDGTKIAASEAHCDSPSIGIWSIDESSIQDSYINDPSKVINELLWIDVGILAGERDCTTPESSRVFLWDPDMNQDPNPAFLQGVYQDQTAGLDYSPQTGRAISGGDFEDNQIRLHHLETGLIERTLAGHSGDGNSVFLSEDGETVLTGSDDFLANLWDARTGEQLLTFGENEADRHQGTVDIAIFSPNESRVATGGRDDKVKIWNRETGELEFTLPDPSRPGEGHTGWVRTLSFLPGGEYLVSAGDEFTIRMWDIETGTLEKTFEGHTGYVDSIDVSHDGSRLISGGLDKIVYIWDIPTAEAITSFTLHTSSVRGVALSPNGQLAASAGASSTPGNGEVYLWDALNGALIYELTGHESTVYDIAFSPDGQSLLTSSSDGTARIWDVSSGTQASILQNDYADLEPVYFGQFSADGRQVATTGAQGASFLWELNPPRAIIIAGGGDYAGNSIKEQTRQLAKFALQTLLARGYRREDVLHLSAFHPDDVDGDGQIDTDGYATLESLHEAITGPFGQEASRLLITFVNHGEEEGGEGFFLLNPGQALTATKLKSDLDELQSTSPVDVTCIFDFCYSGTFVQNCGTDVSIPAERERLLIAGSDAESLSVFLRPPDLTSFTYLFFSTAYMGGSFGQSLASTSDFFTLFPIAGQLPISTDRNGDGSTAYRSFLGASWIYGVRRNFDTRAAFNVFENVSIPSSVQAGQPIPVTAELLAGEDPESVTVTFRPPVTELLSGVPVVELPTVNLSKSDPLTWAGDAQGVFETPGLYEVSVVAHYDSKRVSPPWRTTLRLDGPEIDFEKPLGGVLVIAPAPDSPTEIAFQRIGSFAYNTLSDRFRDINGDPRPDWITYLSPYIAKRAHSLRAEPSTVAVLDAISNQDPEVENLYIHIVASGANDGMIEFAPGDQLTAMALRNALNGFQSAREDSLVTVCIDAPGAGSFVPLLSGEGNHDRIVITSTRPNGTVFFLNEPSVSFSEKFLGAAWQGNTIADCFISSRNFVEDFLQYYLTTWGSPLIDTDGDGSPDASPGGVALTSYIGRAFSYGSSEASGLPFLLEATPDQTIDVGESAQLTARVIEGIVPTAVYVYILPSGIQDTDIITEIGEIVELQKDVERPSLWTGQSPPDLPSGNHRLLHQAVYTLGGESAESNSLSSAVTVRSSFKSTWVLF